MVWCGRRWSTSYRQIHRHSPAHLPNAKIRSPVSLFPNPRSGTDHAGLGTVAEASSRSSWPTLALHPQGWPLWLSADIFSSFTELEKIEELPP